jgi:hypothetical protein
MTQAGTQGVAFARRRERMASIGSSLLEMEKLRKLVSTRTWYGGPRAEL